MAARFVLVRLAGFVAALAAWLALIAGQLGHSNLGIQWAVDNYRVKEALAAGMPRARILVVGGSSVLYGVRADDLGRALGWPALNFGNHAGLGLQYVLDRADRWVGPGDVVVLGLEYELYNQGQMNTLLVDLLMADDPRYLAHLAPPRFADALTQVTMERVLEGYGIGGHTLGWSRLHYHLLPHLDGQGDELRNHLLLRKHYERNGPDVAQAVDMTLSPANAAILGAMMDRWRARGATVIAVAPPLLERPQYRDGPHLAQMQALLAFHEAHGVPYVLRPAEALYPRRDFYDTQYHLDSAAAHLHTARIVERLRGRLPARGDATPWDVPVPTHRLADFFARYDGWEPRSGNLLIDDTDLGREPFVRLTPGTAVIGARTVQAGAARLQAQVLAPRGATLHVRTPGGADSECPVEPGAIRTLDLPLGTVADGDDVEITVAEGLEAPSLRLAWPAASPDAPATGCAKANPRR